jgi:hypothetical protein
MKWKKTKYDINFLKIDGDYLDYIECPLCGEKLQHHPYKLHVKAYTEGDREEGDIVGMYMCKHCYLIFGINASTKETISVNNLTELHCANVDIYEYFHEDDKRYYRDSTFKHLFEQIGYNQPSFMFCKNLINLYNVSGLKRKEFILLFQKHHPCFIESMPFPTIRHFNLWKKLANCIPQEDYYDDGRLKDILDSYYPDINVKDMYVRELEIKKLSAEELFIRQVENSYKPLATQILSKRPNPPLYDIFFVVDNVITKSKNKFEIDINFNDKLCRLTLFPSEKYGVLSTVMKFGELYFHSKFSELDECFNSIIGADHECFYQDYKELKKKYYHLYFEDDGTDLTIYMFFEIPNGPIDIEAYRDIAAVFGCSVFDLYYDMMEASRRSKKSAAERKAEDDEHAYMDYYIETCEAEAERILSRPPKSYSDYDDIDDLENNPDFWCDLYDKASDYKEYISTKKPTFSKNNTTSKPTDEYNYTPFSTKFIKDKTKKFVDYRFGMCARKKYYQHNFYN